MDDHLKLQFSPRVWNATQSSRNPNIETGPICNHIPLALLLVTYVSEYLELLAQSFPGFHVTEGGLQVFCRAHGHGVL